MTLLMHIHIFGSTWNSVPWKINLFQTFEYLYLSLHLRYQLVWYCLWIKWTLCTAKFARCLKHRSEKLLLGYDITWIGCEDFSDQVCHFKYLQQNFFVFNILRFCIVCLKRKASYWSKKCQKLNWFEIPDWITMCFVMEPLQWPLNMKEA